jgi:hypothetical protein
MAPRPDSSESGNRCPSVSIVSEPDLDLLGSVLGGNLAGQVGVAVARGELV